ncbi:MAG: hypothetical protein GY742_22520, partial [Hyphomicrobiales bacterium]|nr:hypothetical protein [Hyphomicrobiales bacterium]
DSEDPSTATARTFTVTVNDGVLDSDAAVSTIAVSAVNDEPTLAATAADDSLTENTDVTSGAVFPTVTIDPIETSDSISEAQLTLAGGLEDSDIINVNGTAITGLTTTSATGAALASGGTYDYNHTTGVLTIHFAGSTSAAAAETILEAITFGIDASDNDPSTTARTVTLNTVTDNGGGADTNADINETATITVNAMDDAPTLINVDNSTWVEDVDVTAKIIDTNVDLADVDSDTVTQITVQITANLDNAEDVLAFAGDANFNAGTYNATTGLLTITSTGASAT